MIASRLKQMYVEEIVPNLMEKLHYKSIMQVPKIKKISINQGLGAAVNDKKLIQSGVDELTLITGQKAVATKAKKSISNFKLREHMPIGAKVTLRGRMMYEFLDRLISVALPRVRDFRGLNYKGFDGNGNYTLGIKEQIIFPEISIDKINRVAGMNITIVIDSDNDKESYELLKAFGMPFISKN
jgi:large subunit ribosomal protein L5|tara:strand:+ start:1611 stop:2162 length:552 start_codon:yes stop_codon:yes gene_type:complete